MHAKSLTPTIRYGVKNFTLKTYENPQGKVIIDLDERALFGFKKTRSVVEGVLSSRRGVGWFVVWECRNRRAQTLN
jgi:hypothetical protein